jgi:hypothetical protein
MLGWIANSDRLKNTLEVYGNIEPITRMTERIERDTSFGTEASYWARFGHPEKAEAYQIRRE